MPAVPVCARRPWSLIALSITMPNSAIQTRWTLITTDRLQPRLSVRSIDASNALSITSQRSQTPLSQKGTRPRVTVLRWQTFPVTKGDDAAPACLYD